MRRIRATTTAVEKQYALKYSGRVCSLRYSACNADKPHYHLRPIRIYSIFSANGTFFEKNVIEYKMCVLIFSTIYLKHFTF